jgi:hypothetical protein
VQPGKPLLPLLADVVRQTEYKQGDWQDSRATPQFAPERAAERASPGPAVAQEPAAPTAGHGRLLPPVEFVPERAGDTEEVLGASPVIDGGGPRKGLDALTVTGGSPAPSEAARSIATQLAAAVSSNGEGKFEIQLSPEELGRVTVAMQVTDDSVMLVVHAERQETLDLMRRHADILQREFREAGFTTLNFSFGQGAQDGRAPRALAEPLRSDDVAAGSSALRPAHEERRAAASSRLDLRL